MTVELLFDRDCPNVDAARAQLRRALSIVGWPETWKEIELSGVDVPKHAQGYGSPTVLVGRCDVSEGGVADGRCCRVYSSSGSSRSTNMWWPMFRRVFRLEMDVPNAALPTGPCFPRFRRLIGSGIETSSYSQSYRSAFSKLS